MAFVDQIITSPISLKDIQTALGSSSPDLKTLVTTRWINMLSKHKPTNYENKGFTPTDAAWNLYWKGSDEYYGGNNNYFGCGYVPPYLSLDGNTLDVNGLTLDAHMRGGSGSGQYWLGSMYYGITSSQRWTAFRAKRARIVDFLYYTTRTPAYERTGNVPFYVTAALPQAFGTTLIDASAQIVFQWEDVSLGVGDACFLGVKSLFGCEQNSGGEWNKSFGLLVQNTANTRHYLLIVRGAFSKMDGRVDSTTGLDYIKNVSVGNINIVGGNYFKQGDKVNVIPCVMAKNTVTNKYYFWPLCLNDSSVFTFTLKSTPTQIQVVHVNSITITLNYDYVRSHVFDFYIANSQSIVMSTTSVNGNYNINNKLYFTQNYCNIGPADGTGSVIEVVSGVFGTHSPDTNGYRYSVITSDVSYTGTVLQSYGRNNIRTRLSFAQSSTSSSVGITVAVYHRGSTATTSSMERKYFNLTFTIDPSTTNNGTVTAIAY